MLNSTELKVMKRNISLNFFKIKVNEKLTKNKRKGMKRLICMKLLRNSLPTSLSFKIRDITPIYKKRKKDFRG